jgi:hypothetical protein
VNEVQTKGEVNSERTEDETEIAFFWANDLDQTYKPPGHLFDITRIVAEQQRITDDMVETARLFALVGMALADAAVVSWHAKYLFPGNNRFEGDLLRLWRPESAIHEAGNDGNDGTTPDASWQPLSVMRDDVTHFSPNFPAYTSGHATFGAAHAAAMKTVLGDDNITFTATTDDPHAKDVSRTFKSFTAAALENGRSRVYLGVHYQWDADGGFESGSRVGEDVAGSLLRRTP